MLERRFTPEDVKELFHFPDMIRNQADGAKAFIKQIGENKYNFMAYNSEKERVVTALKNIRAYPKTK